MGKPSRSGPGKVKSWLVTAADVLGLVTNSPAAAVQPPHYDVTRTSRPAVACQVSRESTTLPSQAEQNLSDNQERLKQQIRDQNLARSERSAQAQVAPPPPGWSGARPQPGQGRTAGREQSRARSRPER